MKKTILFPLAHRFGVPWHDIRSWTLLAALSTYTTDIHSWLKYTDPKFTHGSEMQLDSFLKELQEISKNKSCVLWLSSKQSKYHKAARIAQTEHLSGNCFVIFVLLSAFSIFKIFIFI